MTGPGEAYCLGAVKRGFDLGVALLGLVLLSPILIGPGLVVLVASGPPILFRQERVGKDGRPFRLVKFRTMRTDVPAGLAITASKDPRITPVGRLLRATKLDELPQLINVLRGEMSLVGPRPEVARYAARYDARQRGVLRVRPGLTDPATVAFRDEESLLGAVDAQRREAFYLNEILPKKLALNLEYIEHSGFWYDLGLILKTLKVMVFRERP